MEYQKEYTNIDIKKPTTDKEKNDSMDRIVMELINLRYGYSLETLRCEKRPNYETGHWEFINNNQIVKKIEMTTEDYRVKPIM